MINGVSDFPSDTKYYDIYSSSIVDEEYNRRILGDTTGEMGPFTDKIYGLQTRQIGSWYDDEGWFVWSSAPWFLRSGDHTIGSDAGMFAFNNNDGRASNDYSFRVVLSF